MIFRTLFLTSLIFAVKSKIYSPYLKILNNNNNFVGNKQVILPLPEASIRPYTVSHSFP